VFAPPPEEHFAYRRAPIERVFSAIRQLVVDAAVRGGFAPAEAAAARPPGNTPLRIS
jgi:hypothetical protein